MIIYITNPLNLTTKNTYDKNGIVQINNAADNSLMWKLQDVYPNGQTKTEVHGCYTLYNEYTNNLLTLQQVTLTGSNRLIQGFKYTYDYATGNMYLHRW